MPPIRPILVFDAPHPSGDDAGSIPEHVLEEIDAAWERAARLADEGRHLHLAMDPATGRLRAELRGPGGAGGVPLALADLLDLSANCRSDGVA